jgi:cytoskeleton protein RodZ
MPEIGATLREARTRARIDISEIEAQTKIRAKYLRALENEEWELLPGPTYVKSFLRTYAEALGLDGKRLVEEYKLQFERLSDVEQQPIAPPGQRRSAGPPRPRIGRLWLIGLAVVVLVAALAVLGRGGGGDDNAAAPVTTTTTNARDTTTAQTTPTRRQRRPTAARRVRLQVVPSGSVYVCLEGDGKRIIGGRILAAGASSKTFRAKRFDVTLGNGQVTIRVNGTSFNVPQSADPLGYRFTTKGRTALSEQQRPTCT